MSVPDYRVEFATVEELNFIMDAWCAGQADQPHQLVDSDIFKVEMRARVMRLVSKCKVAVARVLEPDASGRRPVLGFICYGWDKNTHQPVVHYVYVKGAHRQCGIARNLCVTAAALREGRTWWHTHTTPRAQKLAKAHGGVFNPFLLDFSTGNKVA